MDRVLIYFISNGKTRVYVILLAFSHLVKEFLNGLALFLDFGIEVLVDISSPTRVVTIVRDISRRFFTFSPAAVDSLGVREI